MLRHRRSQHCGYFVGEKSRGIYQTASFDFAGCACYANFSVDGLELLHLCMRDDMRALIRGYARVRFHQLLTGNDSGGGNRHGVIARDVRFAGANPCAIHDRQTFDAILSRIFHQRRQLGRFCRGCGHDQFSGVAVRHAMRGAKFVGQNISADAMAGLQGSRRIIKPCVNHAAIARACAHADFRQCFEHEHVVPAS